MASTFTWIDHSETERRRMLDTLELFRERGTRDELGLSVIRDGFAELMFPGTGSLQTWARYFFFIPWMYQRFEANGVRSEEVGRKARQFEVKLIDALAASNDARRPIGIQKRSALQRMPSNIYWNGLKRLGIRLFQGSQDHYHRTLDEWHRQQRRAMRDDDGVAVSGASLNWRPGMPPAPAGFPDTADFKLSIAEADYLRERILAEAPLSLFAYFTDRFTSRSDVPYVWDHPISGSRDLPITLGRQILHARNFAEVMQGATILYNIMLAESDPPREELQPALREQFDAWCADVRLREHELRAWDRLDFWRQVYEAEIAPTMATRGFVDRWIDHVLETDDVATLPRSTSARALISGRERLLKRALARLENPRARELWNGNSGLARLEYRWRNAQIVLNDIFAARDESA